jgi:type I restriction enzyme S subunit
MKYIFYLFSTIDFSTLHKGTTIPTIDNKTIGKLIYALPPLEEQRRIVEAIESIFAKIDEITNALT